MSGTYKAIGINLKSAPLGEADRLLTILTEEYGLLRVVAPGARKHKSSLGGRSSLFVVNHLLLAKGRNLDKIVQAETIESYPGLSQDLGKLTASQYLAELVLYQALSDQPQVELFGLLREHLSRLEQLPNSMVLVCLIQSTLHLLTVAGLAPQVHTCCVTQQPVTPDFADPDWRIGFSAVAGGIVCLSDLASSHGSGHGSGNMPNLSTELNAIELDLLQRLAQPDLLPGLLQVNGAFHQSPGHHVGLSLERTLRQYAQYHFDRPIRSAALIDTCFSAQPPSLLQPL